MARTTDYLTFMVDVTPYEHEGNNYNALNIIVAYRKGQGFVICWQPVRKTDMGYITGPMPSRDPLVGGKGFVAKEASRKNAKILEMMKAALLLGAEGIKFFFDQRNYDRLKEFMCDVCNYGYTADVEKQLQETINNNSTDNNSKSQENMKLNLSNTKNESANVQNAQVANITIAPIKVAEGSVPMSPEAFLAEHGDIEDAEFEEVKSEEVKSEKSLPAVTFSTYKTKKGDAAPQIIGFSGEDDPRYKAVKKSGAKWVSAGWKKDLNGNKVFVFLFGTKYMDVAKALAGAYNTPDVDAWHRAEDACMAIYEQAQRDGKARWEEKKAQWAAARSEKLKVKSEELAAAESAEKQVAAMLEKLMKGEDVPESILKHIDPEVLAKFTKAA